MPPSSTVPPSGTLTVVVTVTNEKVGNCTVMPSVVVVASSVLGGRVAVGAGLACRSVSLGRGLRAGEGELAARRRSG